MNETVHIGLNSFLSKNINKKIENKAIFVPEKFN